MYVSLSAPSRFSNNQQPLVAHAFCMLLVHLTSPYTSVLVLLCTDGYWFTLTHPDTLPLFRSGASVNVGRSLRAEHRGQVADALGLPCGHYPGCDADWQVQDKLWCTMAFKKGFDSIQIQHPHGDPTLLPELLMCKGCDKTALNGACPPVPLRRGTWDNRTSPCVCSNKGDNLNCGDGSRPPLLKCSREAASWPKLSSLDAEVEDHGEMTRVCGVRQCHGEMLPSSSK